MRQSLAASRNNGKYVPLRIYRSHARNSLSVSDVQSGMWCQSQLEYRYLYPHMKRTKQWEKKTKEGKEILKRTPVMIKGSDMHEKKGNNILVFITVWINIKLGIFTKCMIISLLFFFLFFFLLRLGIFTKNLIVMLLVLLLFFVVCLFVSRVRSP